MTKWFRWIWLAGTLALSGEAFYQAMYLAPTEATMGDIQRIFYYHFPSAMLTFFFFFISFAASIAYLALRNRDPLRAMNADALALAGAEMGVVFCTAVLIQGPLWARPVWGIWWTWDARLTSTLVMWLIYCSWSRSSDTRTCRSSTTRRSGGAPSILPR
jgi:heme exporter protein C